jgi:3-deoxy-7-phosphoheptulonate synthase
VRKIALASAAAGADGVIYEVHEIPEEAASDGQQTLNFDESALLCQQLKRLKEVSL